MKMLIITGKNKKKKNEQNTECLKSNYVEYKPQQEMSLYHRGDSKAEIYSNCIK